MKQDILESLCNELNRNESNHSLIETILNSEIETITESRNCVYKINHSHLHYNIPNSLIIKLINQQKSNPLGNVECLMYKILENQLFFPECYQMGSINNYDFLILENIDGFTLLNLIEENIHLNESDYEILLSNVMKQCVDIIRKLSTIKIDGFGPIILNSNINNINILNSSLILEGKFKNYSEFINITIQEQKCLLYQMEKSKIKLLEEYFKQLERFFSLNTHYHSNQQQDDENNTNNSNITNNRSSLILVDANPANFIISHNEQLIMIDLEVFIGGDELFGIGMWMANLYGTSAFNYFKKYYSRIFTNEEECICIAFAIFRILNIMIHLGLNTDLVLENVKPFGNNETFMNLLFNFSNILKLNNY